MTRDMSAAVAAVALLAVSAPASLAHVTLETSEAPASSFYKAVLRVPHGCEGSPTVALRVQIPDGFMRAKPMPKPGWNLETVIRKLDQPYDYYGTMITEDVSEIIWSGGNLRDDFYDEFVFRAKLPDREGETIYISVIQECEKGVHRWIEIPAEGKTADDYEEPAPALTLTPKLEGE
jgi:uncharacterized protein YcnI